MVKRPMWPEHKPLAVFNSSPLFVIIYYKAKQMLFSSVLILQFHKLNGKIILVTFNSMYLMAIWEIKYLDLLLSFQ